MYAIGVDLGDFWPGSRCQHRFHIASDSQAIEDPGGRKVGHLGGRRALRWLICDP
jgi:hypothetical protein